MCSVKKNNKLAYIAAFMIIALNVACDDSQDFLDDDIPASSESTVFVREGRTWNIHDFLKKNEYSYTISGDINIRGMVFKKVYKSEPSKSSKPEYFCAVKQVGDKVYIVRKGHKDYSLLYDFDISKNSYRIKYGKHDFYIYPRRINGMRWIINGIERYMYIFTDNNSDCDCASVIFSGLGCMEDPFDMDKWLHYHTSILSCYDGETCIYDIDKSDEYAQYDNVDKCGHFDLVGTSQNVNFAP